MLMLKYGRLSVLFWTQVLLIILCAVIHAITLFWLQLLALGFLVGTTFAPNIQVFAGMCPSCPTHRILAICSAKHLGRNAVFDRFLRVRIFLLRKILNSDL
jgi:hypothetical protein